MEQANSGNKNEQTLQHQAHKDSIHDSPPRRWPIVLAVFVLLIVAISGVAVILWASNAIDDLAVALNFIAQNTLSLFVLLAIIGQSFIYWEQRNLMRKQWRAMTDGLHRTDCVIKQMKIQLDEIRLQRTVMRRQAIAALSEARSTRDTLTETKNIVSQNESIVTAMQGQEKTMQGELEALKKQVELAGKQTELTTKQITLMIENERAYIGVRKLQLIGLNDSLTKLAVQVVFRNGGNSPAFGFKYYAEVYVGDKPEPFTWKEITTDIIRVFFPGREDRKVKVPCFGVADAKTIIGDNPTNQIFIDGEARYTTLGGKDIALCFGSTYNPTENVWESRYQRERETVTPGTAYLKLTALAPPKEETEPESKSKPKDEKNGENPN